MQNIWNLKHGPDLGKKADSLIAINEGIEDM